MSNVIENNPEMQRLAEINEELLRGKGKLMQEIVELKKKIEVGEKNQSRLNELEKQVAKLNADIVEQLLDNSLLKAKVDELKRSLLHAEAGKENAMAEIKRLQNLKWYQRLFRPSLPKR